MCERCDETWRSEPREAPCGYRKCRHPESAHGFRRREYIGQDGRPHWSAYGMECQEPGCPCRYYRDRPEHGMPECVKCGEQFLRHDTDDKHRICPECREPYQKQDEPDVLEMMRREHRHYGVDLDAA